MRALIVEDGYSRGALAAARALGAAGWVVGVAGPRRVGLAASSRWTASWHRIEPPDAGLDAFVESVRSAVDAGAYEVVFGGGDAELLALSAARDRVGAAVPYAAHDVVVQALDKLSLVRAAEAAGLAVPRTVPASEGPLGLPVVVKARLHAETRLEALIATSDTEAAARVAELRELGAEPILQELVDGRLVAHTVVVDAGGEVVARVQQEADGTWPPDVGASVRARTVPVDRDLAAGVDRLVRGLGWFGLAELQLLAPADGPPRLIDLNGRFYGSLALALAAGVNLPAVWAALATGRRPPPAGDARIGVRYHWLEGDLRRARRTRTGGVADAWRYSRGAVPSVWSRRDPRPGARYVVHLAGRALRKATS